MSSVRVNNITISYEVLGEGPPIILVHGFASNRIVNWKTSGWYKHLVSMDRQVIALDLRGHGQSDKLYGTQDYAPDIMGQDILGLMDYLGIGTADIMGYSMGALLAVHLMATRPERFTSGVLGGVGSTILSLNSHAERINLSLTTPSPELITDPFLKRLRYFAEELNNDLRSLAACNRAVHGKSIPPLDKIPHPVLIVAGEKDDVAGAPDILVDNIVNATLVMVPERDHVSLVTAKQFRIEVGAFLKSSK